MVTFKILSNKQKWRVLIKDESTVILVTEWADPGTTIMVDTSGKSLTGYLYFERTDAAGNYEGYGVWTTLEDGFAYIYDDWKQEMVVEETDSSASLSVSSPAQVPSWLPAPPWHGPPLPQWLAIKWPGVPA